MRHEPDPAYRERRQRLDNLLERIEDAISPAEVHDVTDVVSSLTVSGIMQMSTTKEAAFEYLEQTYKTMRSVIEHEFEKFKARERRSMM